MGDLAERRARREQNKMLIDRVKGLPANTATEDRCEICGGLVQITKDSYRYCTRDGILPSPASRD